MCDEDSRLRVVLPMYKAGQCMFCQRVASVPHLRQSLQPADFRRLMQYYSRAPLSLTPRPRPCLLHHELRGAPALQQPVVLDSLLSAIMM